MLHETASETPTTTPHGPSKGTPRRGFGRLRALPSGRWQAAYTGPDGQVYKASATFDDEDAARGWLSKERRVIESEEWTPPANRAAVRTRSRETFEHFAKTWLDTRQVRGRPLKPRTRDHYQQLLDRFILPTFGGRLLATITTDDVEAWYDELDASTPTYRSHAYSLLRSILGSVDPRVLPANPARIRGAGSARRAHKVEPLTLPELAALVDAMPEAHRLMVLLAAWCALRFGELTELRRKDLDLTNEVVKVRRAVVRTSSGVIVGTPKSEAGSRDVAIPPHLVPLIRQHLREHVTPGRESLLFPGGHGEHLAPSTFYGKAPRKVKTGKRTAELRGGSGFYRARAVAGRPDMHFHDLRHTGAVLAAQTGATLAELMGRLGHSTPAAALRYQHVARDRDKAIAAALSAMVKGVR